MNATKNNKKIWLHPLLWVKKLIASSIYYTSLRKQLSNIFVFPFLFYSSYDLLLTILFRLSDFALQTYTSFFLGLNFCMFSDRVSSHFFIGVLLAAKMTKNVTPFYSLWRNDSYFFIIILTKNLLIRLPSQSQNNSLSVKVAFN